MRRHQAFALATVRRERWEDSAPHRVLAPHGQLPPRHHHQHHHRCLGPARQRPPRHPPHAEESERERESAREIERARESDRERERERERVRAVSACIRRHQASALAPIPPHVKPSRHELNGITRRGEGSHYQPGPTQTLSTTAFEPSFIELDGIA
jgi:hypothetical protein